MGSKYDAFWEERRCVLQRMLAEAMEGHSAPADVSSLRRLGERKSWYGSVEVQGGRIVAGGQAAHARSLGRLVARLANAHPEVRWRETITSDLKLCVKVAGCQSGAARDADRRREPRAAPGVLLTALPCDPRDQARRIHQLVWHLPRRQAGDGFADLPANGIYFFFEHGEWFDGGLASGPRIPRVGINEAQDTFPSRLRNHFHGNRGSSIFRKHLGAALLASRGMRPEVVKAWERGGVDEWGGVRFDEVEREVSAILRERFSYACVPLNDPDERRRMEAWVIGVLAAGGPEPSAGWLGRHSPRQKIRASGLWNVEHVGAAAAADAGYLGRLEEAVTGLSGPAQGSPAERGRGVLIILPCSADKRATLPDRPSIPPDRLDSLARYLPRTAPKLSQGREALAACVDERSAPIPALDRYDGHLYRVGGLRETLASVVLNGWAKVLILSGAYGAVLANEPIQLYDQKMNVVHWTRHGLPEVIEEFVRQAHIGAVYAFVAASGPYRKLLDRVDWGSLRPAGLREAWRCTVDLQGAGGVQVRVPRALGEAVVAFVKGGMDVAALARGEGSRLGLVCRELV